MTHTRVIEGMVIREARPADRREMASIHKDSISKGFLSNLGVEFLCLLYGFMAGSGHALCFVAEKDGRVVGFVSGTTDVGLLYKEFVRRHLIRAGLILLRKALRPKYIVKAFETLFYPSSAKEGLPKAELLSTAVLPEHRGSGIARELFLALSDGFRARGVKQFKVVVGANLQQACRFYAKMGGTLVGQTQVHKDEPSHVYSLVV